MNDDEYGMFRTALTEVYRLTTGRVELETEVADSYFRYLARFPLRDVVGALESHTDLGSTRFPSAPELRELVFVERNREAARDNSARRALGWDKGSVPNRERRMGIWRKAMLDAGHDPEGVFSRRMFAAIERAWGSEDRRRA